LGKELAGHHAFGNVRAWELLSSQRLVMDIPEFTDTYSDDLTFLEEARETLLSRKSGIEAKWCEASFCRMFAVLMVGSIESLLEERHKESPDTVLGVYLDERTRNGDKVKNLCDAFTKAGGPVDPEIFSDYLAIKYLRNSIIHARKKDHEVQWLAQRGFPADTRQLEEKHWQKMQQVNTKMMLYIVGARCLRYRNPQ
jgi:hypothetical protein